MDQSQRRFGWYWQRNRDHYLALLHGQVRGDEGEVRDPRSLERRVPEIFEGRALGIREDQCEDFVRIRRKEVVDLLEVILNGAAVEQSATYHRINIGAQYVIAVGTHSCGRSEGRYLSHEIAPEGGGPQDPAAMGYLSPGREPLQKCSATRRNGRSRSEQLTSQGILAECE